MIALALLMLCTMLTFAQTSYTTDASGNLTQVVTIKSEADMVKGAIKTSQLFTTASGDQYPVYQSATNRLFVVRTSKTGNHYKQYLEEKK